MKRLPIALSVLALLAVGILAAANQGSIRVDKSLVLIPVAVSTPLGQYVTGLSKDNFKLYENGVEQQIESFSSEDAPLSVGLVFDISGSMGDKLERSKQAVLEFMKSANPPGKSMDEYMLVQFNDQAQLTAGFTPNTEEIQNHLLFAPSKGRTALLDAVYMAMNEMKRAHNPRKAILIVSDGGDNSSRYNEPEVRQAVREADVQIYSIGIFEDCDAGDTTPEEAEGPGLLRDLAEVTGGRDFAVDRIREMPDITAKIELELRNQYVLGYSPKNKERDGKYRRVQVKLVNNQELGQMRPRWRQGYYAPAE